MYIVRAIILIIIMPLFTVFFPPCVRADDNLLFEKGKLYFQSGQYYFSTTWLERLIRGYPRFPHRKEALAIISQAYSLSDRDEKAALYMDILRREFPDTASVIATKEFRLTELLPSPLVAPAVSENKKVLSSAYYGGLKEPPVNHANRGESQQSTPPSTTQKSQPLLSSPKQSHEERTASAPAIHREDGIHSKSVSPPAPATIPDKITVSPVVATPAFPSKQSDSTVEPIPVIPSTSQSPSKEVRVAERNNASYTLLVDASVRRQKLNKQINSLRSKGLQPVIQKISKTMNVFRLVTQSFGTESDAQKKRAEISPLTKQVFVIHMGKQYSVVAASFFSYDDAQIGQQKLHKKKLRTEVVKSNVSMPVWQITIGNYDNSQQAEMSLKSLAEKGVSATVIPRNL